MCIRTANAELIFVLTLLFTRGQDDTADIDAGVVVNAHVSDGQSVLPVDDVVLGVRMTGTDDEVGVAFALEDVEMVVRC